MGECQRNRPAPGSYLPVLETDELVEVYADVRKMDVLLSAQGYERSKYIRPYLADDGRVTMRVVWRRRTECSSVGFTVTKRADLVMVE